MTDTKYARQTISIKFTNFKKIYFNHSRDLECVSCNTDLHESYVVSGNRRKVRCLKCAEKYHIIEKIPDELKGVQ